MKTVDAWAATQPGRRIFAQIGPSDYRPTAMEFAADLDPATFEQYLTEAELIIAHAGMGTILKALELGKPVLIMPRRASLGEQRNEHQLATAERFERLGIVQVAQDEIDLARRLESLDSVQASKRISDSASPELISHLRAFLARHLGEV
ncbi:MAG: glycosyltransferase [Planctomycetota bacterium]